MNRHSVFPALVLLFLSRAATAADAAYMTVTDQNGAVITGGVTAKGHEKSMQVLSLSHEVVVAIDPSTGLPTGKRQHKPLVVTKPVDQATPLLLQALVASPTLKQVEIKFFSTGADGREVSTYTIRLTNVHITSLVTTLPDARDPKNAGLSQSDTVSFVYQKIEWICTTPSIIASDSWSSPV